jgi:hypothetical protein
MHGFAERKAVKMTHLIHKPNEWSRKFMSASSLKFIKRCAECVPKEKVKLIPRGTRGIYTLLKHSCENYNVVYIGLAREGIHGRLNEHIKSKRDLWSHFSIFEVWDNITDEEIQELEGLFRHIFRHDENANSIAKQKSFRKLSTLRKTTSSDEAWKNLPYKG